MFRVKARAGPTTAHSLISRSWRRSWLAACVRPTGRSRRDPSKPELKVHAGTSRSRFMKSVERAKEYIAAGDIFQVVLSQRLDFYSGSCALRYLSRPAHRESFALHVFSSHGRHPRAGLVSGDAGARDRTQAGISSDCRNPSPRAAMKPKMRASKKKCSPTKKNAPNTSCWSTSAATIWAA